MAQRDNTSNMDRVMLSIASEAVSQLRKASDAHEFCTPKLVGEVQLDVQRILSQVYYGFHPKLEQK